MDWTRHEHCAVLRLGWRIAAVARRYPDDNGYEWVAFPSDGSAVSSIVPVPTMDEAIRLAESSLEAYDQKKAGSTG